MTGRPYRLGRRQPAVDRTRATILAAARELVVSTPSAQVSIGAVARLAAVSRITVYNQFGSKQGLLDALGSRPPELPGEMSTEPVEALRRRVERSCAAWATNPGLHRNLPPAVRPAEIEHDRLLAERLAAGDRLRPGCSIKEAEDVIGVVTSFQAFDLLHGDGRRSTAAVAGILMRLAGGILA
ncbi:MAG TPA: helix-turn-helix domain-containing protein [Candidatus Dormibacteraeota bacterium]|jgi:AcrR family transcriptional regulator